MKAKRDPDRPKRYMTAFLLFLGEFRKKNADKGYSNTDMTKTASKVWKSLKPYEKNPYEDLSLKLKDKYTREFKKYKAKIKSRPKEDVDLDGPSKKVKDPNKPKRPLSSYMLFMQDFRKKNANRGWDVRDMVSNGALVWKALSTHERRPYTTIANKHSERFHKKLTTYKLKQKKKDQMQKDKKRNSTVTKQRTTTKSKAKTPSRALKTKRRSSASSRRPVTSSRRASSSGRRRR